MRVLVVLASFVCAATAAASAWSSPGRAPVHPVPSHTPAATHRLWEWLVHHPRRTLADASCTPVRLIFYAQDDWLRLATKLAADAAPCAQYYISIPPLAADKTSFRTAQAAQISALGPNFHPVAEVNYNGWSNWVTANTSTFHAAGVEARKRLAAAGYDTWAVNELSSAVRAGTNVARQKIRDLVQGLYAADGALPNRKGIVFDIGVGQPTADLAPYKVALQNWFQDSGFWHDMSAYVDDWSQESYGDVRNEAVAGAPIATRVQYLDDYLGHQQRLADAAPGSAAAARAFLDAAASPLANAAWIWDSAFGYTDVPLEQMEDYVSAQVAALRSLGGASFGFAWAPRMAGGSAWTQQFTSDTGTLLDRLAAALHDSAGAPTGACGTSWCTAGLPGAAFTDAWKTFATWSPTIDVLGGVPATLAAGSPSGQMTVALQTDGVPQTALTDTRVQLATTSPTGMFSAGAGGPWTPTLTLTIPQGAGSAGFYYEDTTPGAATLTAGTATQTVTVTAQSGGPAPGGSGGGGVPPDLHVDLGADAATAPPVGSTLVYRVAVTTTNAGSSSDAQLALTLPSGYSPTQVSADRGPGCTGAPPTLSCDLGWISPGVGTTITIVGTVTADGDLVAGATVQSVVEQEANPADNTTTLRLAAAPAAAAAPPPAAEPRARLTRAPAVTRHGRLLHAAAPIWSIPASRVVYHWQLCATRRRCTDIRGATARTLRVTPRLVGDAVRVRVTAVSAGRAVAATSQLLRIRG